MNLSSMDKDKRNARRMRTLVVLATAISLVAIGCGKGEKEEAPEVSVQAARRYRRYLSRGKY